MLLTNKAKYEASQNGFTRAYGSRFAGRLDLSG